MQLWHHLNYPPIFCLDLDSEVPLHSAGTVLAAELAASDGGGYASGEAKAVVMQLRQQGVFARPLGNVVYLMVTPTTSSATCLRLLQQLINVLPA